MKTNKLISLGKAFAIAVLILGIIHDIATFTPLIKTGLECLSPADLNAIIYMSLMCGTSFIISGIVLILLLRKLEQIRFLTSIIMAIGIFLALAGILSIVFMFDNPFAWASLLLNVSVLLIATALKKQLG
ncbi:MAG: hypothetical protein GXY94_09225 [Bacteroidales bacterium]|jgi:hypothetical protein|nr:hypothetical protein [Bacteroidales bacterium]